METNGRIVTAGASTRVRFQILKSFGKRLYYKCLQGGRVDTVDKIHRTLINEEKLARKSLLKLAEHFGTN